MRYIDVNVLFYWLTDHEEFGETATKIIERIESGERAITSTLTIWLLHILLEETTENYDPNTLIKKIEEIKFLKIVPLTSRHFKKALEHISKYSLDLEDAIHLTIALEYGCNLVYSNDTDFDNAPIKRIFK